MTVNSPQLVFSSIKGSKLHGIVKNSDLNVNTTGPISRTSQVDNRMGYFVMVLVAVSITRGNIPLECGPARRLGRLKFANLTR